MKRTGIFILLVLFLSCSNEEMAIATLVNQKLEAKRQKLILEKTQLCDKEVMKLIENLVDSVLIYQSKKIKYDSLTIPYDSIRPSKPEIIFPEYRKPTKPEKDSLF